MALHDSNRFQWERETEIRKRPAERGAVRIKRAIDDSNHRRMGPVERLDAICAQRIALDRMEAIEGYVNSETIGQLVDRLSILSVKLAFARASTAEGCAGDPASHPRYRDHVRELERQWAYVATCYDRFLAHLRGGTGSMLVSRQLKFSTDARS